MKRNTNAVMATFRQTVHELFVAAGVQIRPLSWHEATPEYVVQTIVGEYTCHAEPDFSDLGETHPLNFLSVMGRFADAQKAHAHVDCNPYTGKWNFDGYGYTPTIDSARSIASQIVNSIINLQTK